MRVWLRQGCVRMRHSAHHKEQDDCGGRIAGAGLHPVHTRRIGLGGAGGQELPSGKRAERAESLPRSIEGTSQWEMEQAQG